MSRLVRLLSVFIAVDVVASLVVFTIHRNDPPMLPEFTQLAAGPRGEVDQLPSLLTLAFGGPEATTTASGGVRRLRDGQADFDPDLSAAVAILQIADAVPATDDDTGTWQLVLTDVADHIDGGFIVHEDLPEAEVPGLPAKWVSAATQGLALAAFSRAYSATGEARWKTAADSVFETFLDMRDEAAESGRKPSEWTGFIDPLDYLWFERFPQATAPSQILTGHAWATLGIAEYHAVAEGGYKAAATSLFRGGAATASYYAEVVRRPYLASRVSPATEERSLSEHRLITAQMSALATETGDGRFARTAKNYERDIALAEFAVTEGELLPGVTTLARPAIVDLLRAAPTAQDATLLRALAWLSEGPRGTPPSRQDVRSAAYAISTLVSLTRHGFLPHTSPRSDVDGRELTTPWYSALTQGLLLSALVRLHEETGTPHWRSEADRIFATFSYFRGYRGTAADIPPRWVAFVGDEMAYSNLWFTGYAQPMDAGEPPSRDVMAQLAAALGLYEYWDLTGSPIASRLVDGAATTVGSRLADIQVAGASESDLSTQLNSAQVRRAVALQLEGLSKITGRRQFAAAASQLAETAT